MKMIDIIRSCIENKKALKIKIVIFIIIFVIPVFIIYNRTGAFLDYINTIGLTCNFVGTLLVIYYIGKDKNAWVEGEEGMEPGEKRYDLYVTHPSWVYFGVILIIIGFCFQISYSLLK